jgi:hypothetical protein
MRRLVMRVVAPRQGEQYVDIGLCNQKPSSSRYWRTLEGSMGGVVADDHDGQSITDSTPYTDHGERLAQCLIDELVDCLALCRGGLCGLLVQFIVYR